MGVLVDDPILVLTTRSSAGEVEECWESRQVKGGGHSGLRSWDSLHRVDLDLAVNISRETNVFMLSNHSPINNTCNVAPQRLNNARNGWNYLQIKTNLYQLKFLCI